MSSRAFRRHQLKRIKNRVKDYWRVLKKTTRRASDISPARVRPAHAEMCGNPRTHFKIVPIHERRELERIDYIFVFAITRSIAPKALAVLTLKIHFGSPKTSHVYPGHG